MENTIKEVLSELTEYYKNQSVCQAGQDASHRETKISLKVSRDGVDLENTAHPKIDRTLSYKQHMQNTKYKVATTRNLLEKLANLNWRTNSSTIKQQHCYRATQLHNVMLHYVRYLHTQTCWTIT